MAGFTLVEMAVVVVIAGIILVSVLPALLDIRRSAQLSATQTNLQSLLRATGAYVQANGCLPCPTPAGASIDNIGRVRGDANPAACGVCTRPDGIVPYVAMGIDPTTAKDGWGRWITMHIDPLLAQNVNAPAAPVVPPQMACTDNDTLPCTTASGAVATPCASGCTAANKGTSAKGLCRAGLATLAGAQPVRVQFEQTTPATAAVIFVSHGANGRGAYQFGGFGGWTRVAFPRGETCDHLQHFEMCNVKYDSSSGNQTDSTFYLFNRGSNFDDVIVYSDRNALVSMFGNGACQTAW